MGRSSLARLRAVLFDADHTLLDTARAERIALRGALDGLGLPFSRDTLARYRQINSALWELYRRGEIDPERLTRERFRRLLAEIGGDPREAARLGRAYLDRISERGDLRPGARSVLSRLRRRYRLGIVTNGLERVQKRRLAAARLDGAFEVVVTSEGCGYTKPDPRILDVALSALSVKPAEAVYVGDDAEVDGGAAAAAGVWFVWLDGGSRTARLRRKARRASRLTELPGILAALARPTRGL